MKRTTLLPIFTAASLLALAQQPLQVIPYPQSVKLSDGVYNPSAPFSVTVNDLTLVDEVKFLENTVKNGHVSLSIDPSISNTEGYRLTIDGDNIKIEGATDAGVFYGIQTLTQLAENYQQLPQGVITDAPRFSWRGHMRDDSRHFTSVESVKDLLDLMARYKLNRFHWHLTDGQGWRIEIKKYPKLATVGGQGSHSDPDAPVAYFTQDEIRDIVDYAHERHIMVIPEIDMPGHATAANRAYPEYNGGGSEQFPDFTFNPGKEETYTFLTDVLTEVAALFPDPYIHIGGDEVAYGIEAWEVDPDVQALMKREGFTNVKQCERYFMNRMIGEVAHLGKTLVGWDELMDLNVDKSTHIMWWRHNKPDYLVNALDNGYTTVLCPRKPLYFDFVQNMDHQVGRKWDGCCPIEDVYAFPDNYFQSLNLNANQIKNIEGMQANAWSELLHTPQRVEYMIWPRLIAMSESAWTEPENKDFNSFMTRMEPNFKLLDSLDIYYYDPRDPQRHPEPDGPVIKKRLRKSETDYRD